MHPLEVLNESELSRLVRVADRLLNTHHLLAPGHRPYRRRAGFGIEFLDHREFSPGDDIRSIDWRATARSRRPQIRRYCDEAAADWFIALDCSASMAGENGEKWSLAVQCAAAMVYLLIHLDNRTGILLFSDRVEQMIPLGRGNTHYASILQTLRRKTLPTSGGGSDLLSCVYRIKRHSPVFVISDFLTADGMQEGLEALSVRGDRLHALQILSSRDYAIPTEPNVTLMDVESGRTLAVDLDLEEREGYRKAVDDFHSAFADYCSKQRICYSRHRDSKDWKATLTDHLLQQNSL
jgi:uncharacterized protein (DUF58 family)